MSAHGFYVSAGLLTPEHNQRIGPALWVYEWMIRYETRSDGKVLNGAPIPISQISRELGLHDNTTSRHLNRLVKNGYLDREAHAGGAFSYTVLNSKKWKENSKPTHTENGATPPPPPTPEMVSPHTRNGATPTPEMVLPHTKNGVGNKERENERRIREGERGNSNGKPAPPAPPVFSSDDLKCARQILSDLVLPAAPETVEYVAYAVQSETAGGLSLDETRSFIVAGSQAARRAGFPLNKWHWIEARYRAENRKKPNTKTFAELNREYLMEEREGALELLRQKSVGH